MYYNPWLQITYGDKLCLLLSNLENTNLVEHNLDTEAKSNSENLKQYL